MLLDRRLKPFDVVFQTGDEKMVRSIYKHEIVLAVVCLFAVQMMNVLIGTERPAKFVGHDNAVLHNFAGLFVGHAVKGTVSRDVHIDVPSGVDAPTAFPQYAEWSLMSLGVAGRTQSCSPKLASIDSANALPLDRSFCLAVLADDFDIGDAVLAESRVPMHKGILSFFDWFLFAEHHANTKFATSTIFFVVTSLACPAEMMPLDAIVERACFYPAVFFAPLASELGGRVSLSVVVALCSLIPVNYAIFGFHLAPRGQGFVVNAVVRRLRQTVHWCPIARY